jgi:hypothetical protein
VGERPGSFSATGPFLIREVIVLKKLATIAIIAISFVAINHSDVNAIATPAYTFDFNATNLYSDDLIFYEFAGLDTTRSYRWTVWTADMQSGERLDSLGFQTIGPGTATGSWTFGAGTGGGDWPEDYTGPIYVIDDRGEILHKHFITPPAQLIDGSGSWETATGNFAPGNKQVISNTLHEGDCRSPVYRGINVDGFHGLYLACAVATTIGDIAIFHFQRNPVAYASPTTDEWVISHLYNGSTAATLTIDLDSLANYQYTAGSTGAPTFTAFYSFLIVNTGSELLPFVDNEWADLAFGADGSTNPYRWGVNDFAEVADGGLGAYYCIRNVAATPVSDCDQTWLVTNDPTPEDVNSAEWTIESLAEVQENRTNTITLRRETEEIHIGYSGASSITDTYSGFLDTNIYPFEDATNIRYTVGTPENENTALAWTVTPNNLPTTAVATVTDMNLITVSAFDITAVVTTSELIEEVIDNLGLESDLGRTALLGAFLMFGLMGVGMSGVRNIPAAYLIVWTGIGGIFVSVGISAPIATLLFFTSTLFLWLAAFTLFSGNLFNTGASDNA